MKCLLGLVCALGVGAAATPDPELTRVLKGVEARYNHAQTLKVAFKETYTASGQPRQAESGELTLRKPGRMRWDYSSPPGKMFLSDGKDVFLYTPDAHRAERRKLKESEDMRAPLAFLLGKLDMNKEFRNFVLAPQGDNVLLTAQAKNDNLPYERIEMLLTPDYSIKRLVVNGQDKSILAFNFDNEQLNPPVDQALFNFHLPAGATLVNGESR